MVLVGFKPDFWRPSGFLQCFDTVVLVTWPVKIVPEMTYYVSSGTLNPTHSLTQTPAHTGNLLKSSAHCVMPSQKWDVDALRVMLLCSWFMWITCRLMCCCRCAVDEHFQPRIRWLHQNISVQRTVPAASLSASNTAQHALKCSLRRQDVAVTREDAEISGLCW